MAKRTPRPLQPVPRYALTRAEAAAAVGISLNHFEQGQPDLTVVVSTQYPAVAFEHWSSATPRACRVQVS